MKDHNPQGLPGIHVCFIDPSVKPYLWGGGFLLANLELTIGLLNMIAEDLRFGG